eukprot:7378645-Prymnesium_polylepis.1
MQSAANGGTGNSGAECATGSARDCSSCGGAQTSAMADSLASANREEIIVQFIVVRRDLLSAMNWPMGSVIAQACHASTAVLFENIDCDPTVLEYFADAAKMHKVIGECA